MIEDGVAGIGLLGPKVTVEVIEAMMAAADGCWMFCLENRAVAWALGHIILLLTLYDDDFV